MIINRLLQALVREQIIPPAYVLLEPPVLQIELADGYMLQAHITRLLSFGRFDIQHIHMIKENRVSELTSAVSLLKLVQETGWLQKTAQYERFCEELQNSEENYALAMQAAQERQQERAEASVAWAEAELARDERFSSLVFYEQLVTEGHPIHPGAKIKMGMSQEDVLRYSPEFQAKPEVRLVAVRKECAVSVGADEEQVTDMLYEEYEGLQAQVAEELGENRLSYDLIPIHPWQYEHTIPSLHRAAIERGELVLLKKSSIPTAALMSFRSLAPLGRRTDYKHHIKTAINVQTTGAVRTVSPNSVENGALLSRVLRAIQENEQYFQGRFRILEEQAGIYYNPNDEGLSEEQKMVLRKNTGAILRENPERFVQSGEIAMPCAALLAQSPFQQKPIAAEVIEQLAGGEVTEEHVVEFLGKYAEVCLPPMLTLMSKYGISMEGHLQNCIIVFRHGLPVRLFVRDFGGVRILEERLEKQGMSISLYKNSAIRAKNGEDLWNKTFYPVFQNHFGELIACLVRYFSVREELLWQPVARVCREAFASLQEDPIIHAAAVEDEQALFAPYMDLKAMTKMRLQGDVTDYTFAKVRNPLAEVQR